MREVGFARQTRAQDNHSQRLLRRVPRQCETMRNCEFEIFPRPVIFVNFITVLVVVFQERGHNPHEVCFSGVKNISGYLCYLRERQQIKQGPDYGCHLLKERKRAMHLIVVRSASIFPSVSFAIYPQPLNSPRFVVALL